jgi:hypothetical protein
VKKTFPIKATCTQCGHSAEVFIDDERAAIALETYKKEVFLALWRPLIVKRIVISWGVAVASGFLLGRLL